MANAEPARRGATRAPTASDDDDEIVSTREKYRRIAEHRRYPKKKSYSFDDLALGLTAMEAGVNRYYAMHAGRQAKRVLDYLAQAAKAMKPDTKAKAIKLARKRLSELSRERHPELAEQIESRILWEEGWRPDTWDAERNAPRTQDPSVNPETGMQEFFFDGLRDWFAEKLGSGRAAAPAPASAPEIPAITVSANPLTEQLGRQAVQVNLPGLSGAPTTTYLDAEFVPKLDKFRAYAGAGGEPLAFASLFRTPERQAELRNDPAATTPAINSLHSAGLAVDVQDFKKFSPERQQSIVDAATRAGLKWGGNFRSPDPVHFYHDPGGDRVKLISDFAERVRRLQTQR